MWLFMFMAKVTFEDGAGTFLMRGRAAAGEFLEQAAGGALREPLPLGWLTR